MSKLVEIRNRHNGEVREVGSHVWDYMKLDGRSVHYEVINTLQEKKEAKRYTPKTKREKIEIKPIYEKKKQSENNEKPKEENDGETN